MFLEQVAAPLDCVPRLICSIFLVVVLINNLGMRDHAADGCIDVQCLHIEIILNFCIISRYRQFPVSEVL